MKNNIVPFEGMSLLTVFANEQAEAIGKPLNNTNLTFSPINICNINSQNRGLDKIMRHFGLAARLSNQNLETFSARWKAN